MYMHLWQIVFYLLVSFATSSNPLNINFIYNNSGSGIRFLEHVVVIATLSTFDDRGDIQLELTSPMDTLSFLLPYRSSDRGSGSYTDWPFQSVHYWGENPNGVWTLTVRYRVTAGSASVTGLSVTLYGTTEIPQAVQRIPSQCDSVCAPSRSCADTGPLFCDACRSLRNAETLECIDQCPSGFTERNGYCYNATLPEPGCMRRFNATVTGVLVSPSNYTKYMHGYEWNITFFNFTLSHSVLLEWSESPLHCLFWYNCLIEWYQFIINSNYLSGTYIYDSSSSVWPDMCSVAEYTACCVTGECRPPNAQCYCDVTCYSLGDCCRDIQDSCLQPPGMPYTVLHTNVYSIHCR